MTADATAALRAAREALWQYSNDLRHPPAADSLDRRQSMIEATLAKVERAIGAGA